MFLKIEKYISKNFLTKFMIIKTVKVSDKGQIAIPLDIFGVFSNVRLKNNVSPEGASLKESMFAIAFGLALR